MKIYSDGKSRVLNGAFPKHFRLLNGEKEVPFIRTGRESIRISGELPVGDLLVDEIIRQKVAQPAKLDAQSLAIINKQDFDRIDILNKKLAINQEKMGEQMNALAEHEATLANLETKNAGDIELLSGQTASAVQLLKGAIEDTEKKNVAVQKALSQAIKETGEDLSDSLVAHETAKNPHRITKATIGLEKVENIKPEDMPVSKATKKELDKKADKKDIAEVEKKLTEKSDGIIKGIERMNMLGGVGGNELPIGGKKGQVLAKASNKTGDYEWSSAAGGVSIHNDLDGRSAENAHPMSAITGLESALTTETTNRENADNGLQSQIDAITASSDVKDIVGTYAQLQAYDTSTLGNNDIIKVLQDETHSDETTYYRWNTTTETFTLIGEEGPYYTKSEANSTFVPQTRTVNGKALSSNITLTYTDVGAINGIDSLMVTTALGYTPVDPSNLATVATTGDYDDLINQPTIPTSNDYWTVGNSSDTSVQKTYSRKILTYKATNDQDNGFKLLGTEWVPSGSYSGYWLGRMLLGTDKHTFLLGTVINGQGNYMCGLGAHSWTNAETQTGAAWDDVYIQPDGNKAVYLGGKQWKYQSGWFKVQNDGNATAAYRTFINTGTNTSPTWRTVLPNQATGTNSVLIRPNTSSTFSYTYATSINGTITANYGTSFGYNASAGSYGVAIGYDSAASGSYSIQLGRGTNSTANTMSVGLSNSLNVQLLDASGEIPDARIKNTIARVSQIPTTASDVGALPDSTKYGADLSYSSNTLQLLDQDGNTLGNSVTIQSSPDIDGKSITTNSDDELQTVGVIDQNNTSNALKQWSGTKAQYDAIVSKDANTIYNITDDTNVGSFANTDLSNLSPTGESVLSGKVDLATGVTQADVDYVVASQLPTSENNYTWYRLYKSGWVEQGAFVSSAGGEVTSNFPITMQDTNYTIFKTPYTNSTNTVQWAYISFYDRTTSSAKTLSGGVGFSWQVSGMSAGGS